MVGGFPRILQGLPGGQHCSSAMPNSNDVRFIVNRFSSAPPGQRTRMDCRGNDPLEVGSGAQVENREVKVLLSKCNEVPTVLCFAEIEGRSRPFP